ncbi:MAG: pteridine reductase [Gammaproteobacteria bacterium]|nr:pteridine reductase [Gammaproteobacteria bacterium]
MTNHNDQPETRVALVTGGSQRIGAAIVRVLHGAGMDVALHYRRSRDAALRLVAELNTARGDSAALFQADLREIRQINQLVDAVVEWRARLDLLVNNASTFYPTPLGHASETQWDDLLDTNLKAPFFLAQAAAPHLRAVEGSIVNLADIHGQQPLKEHPVYSCAKAGNIMLTRSLARELGPEVRVNGVAPGAILWPASGMDDVGRQRIVNRTALKRQGDPRDVAATVRFLALEAPYITGQIIAVDGGRTLGY